MDWNWRRVDWSCRRHASMVRRANSKFMSGKDEVFWRKVIAHLAIPFLLAAALSLTFSALRSLGNGGSFLFVLDTTRLLLGVSRSRQLRGSKG